MKSSHKNDSKENVNFLVFVDDQERKQREVLLFDALTQFMKKSALHSINEIVG